MVFLFLNFLHACWTLLAPTFAFCIVIYSIGYAILCNIRSCNCIIFGLE